MVRKNDNPTTEDLNERYILEDKLGVDTASKDREKLVSDCISKLRNDNDDKSFHTLVVKELRNTKYWNESAAWLKKNNLYELVVNDICVNNPKVKPLHYLKPRPYKLAPSEFTIIAIFDQGGFFSNVETWYRANNDKLVYKNEYNLALYSVQNARFCPVTNPEKLNIRVVFPFEFKYDN